MYRVSVSNLKSEYKGQERFCTWEQFLKLKKISNIKAILAGKAKYALISKE